MYIRQIAPGRNPPHFFQHYKDLEPGTSASVGEWASLEKAHERIMLAIGRHT